MPSLPGHRLDGAQWHPSLLAGCVADPCPAARVVLVDQGQFLPGGGGELGGVIGGDHDGGIGGGVEVAPGDPPGAVARW